MRQVDTLVIPDVHGRDFWVDPVDECLHTQEMCKIVFLGDYLDPYPYEWTSDTVTLMEASSICKTAALDRFKQILDLKKQYPDRITLLLGNHDCGYAIGSDICDCRTDYEHREEIEYLFKDNRNLFQIAEEKTIGGKKFIFSHAGILKGWMDQVRDSRNGQGNPVDFLNNAWLVEDYRVLDHLGEYDGYRGYLGYKYGSPIWSDIRSWTKVTPEKTFGFNIVGHTQLDGDPVVLDQIADLDCRRAFYLDMQGEIRDWQTDAVCNKTRQEK